MNFCIDCGKEVSYGPRCYSCAQKHKSKHNFLDKEKIQMAKLYEDGMILREIGKNFNCPYSTIRKNLIEFLGEERYKKISKEHKRESIKRAHNLPRSEKQIMQLEKLHSLPRSEKQLENIKKATEVAHNLPRSEKQLENIKKAHEACVKGIWISNPEHRFFLTCLSKMFFLKDIEKQYYLKGLNHAFDFAIPSQKLLFEIDGDYWHKDRKERDVEIDNFAKSAGWSIFRFNDSKLKELKII